MTVTDLLAKILAMYPGATPEAIASFKPVFYARFGNREGPHLAEAATEVFATFQPAHRKPFPIPADFEAHLPSRRSTQGDGAAIDLDGMVERKTRILTEWRAAQGHRGANGVLEVLRALEFIAEPIAVQTAWKNAPEPLRLTAKNLRLAQHRAISLARVNEFGPPPKDPAVWWAQIQQIAARWNIPTHYDHWEPRNPERAAA